MKTFLEFCNQTGTVWPPKDQMDFIVDLIVAEAKRRLAEDACCPGGLRAKIHGVAMELNRMIGEEMRRAK